MLKSDLILQEMLVTTAQAFRGLRVRRVVCHVSLYRLRDWKKSRQMKFGSELGWWEITDQEKQSRLRRGSFLSLHTPTVSVRVNDLELYYLRYQTFMWRGR